MKKGKIIKFGIPGGMLKESVEKLFKMAGYTLEINSASSMVYIDDPEIECFFARAGEIASLISKGILDVGIVSHDAIIETKSKVAEIFNLGTSDPAWEKTRLVLAVPNNSPIKSLKDLKGKKIITRVPEITKDFLKKNKISAIVEFSEGTNATRIPIFANAIVEFISTGAKLEYFQLKILAVLMECPIIIAANPESLKDKWKKEKIENLSLLIKGARNGWEMVGLMLHASNDMMERVFKILPSLKKPTVTHLRGENWFDVFTVVNKKSVREVIPQLKRIGCTDIIEFSLRKVIP